MGDPNHVDTREGKRQAELDVDVRSVYKGDGGLVANDFYFYDCHCYNNELLRLVSNYL